MDADETYFEVMCFGKSLGVFPIRGAAEEFRIAYVMQWPSETDGVTVETREDRRMNETEGSNEFV